MLPLLRRRQKATEVLTRLPPSTPCPRILTIPSSLSETMSPRALRKFFHGKRGLPRPILAKAHSNSSIFSFSSSLSSIPPTPRSKPRSTLRNLTLALTCTSFFTLFLTDSVYNSHRQSLEPIIVTGQSHRPSPPPLRRPGANKETIFRGTTQHPVGIVAFHLLHHRNFTSLLDFPCKAHRQISPSLLILQLQEKGEEFQYICADDDSSQLSISHVLMRRRLPKFQGARYMRLTNIQRIPQADLLLHWESGAEMQVEQLRAMLLAARVGGIKMAIVGTKPMKGTSFTPEYNLVTPRRIRNMRPGVYGDAPFPFASAITTISGLYGAERMLVLYDLTVLPEISIKREGEVKEQAKNEIGEERRDNL